MGSQQQLREAGLKVTTPRLKILQLFEQTTDRHLSAENIYKALLAVDEEISLATIYRVLTQFEAAGILVRLNFEEGRSVFELNQGLQHDHAVCIKCGRVEEFTDALIGSELANIAERLGYHNIERSLTLYGTCEKCITSVLTTG